ncbi:ATP-binding protein [Glycocaulis profundi]|nr:ATP-binding protein [Glycocaulis profundi]
MRKLSHDAKLYNILRSAKSWKRKVVSRNKRLIKSRIQSRVRPEAARSDINRPQVRYRKKKVRYISLPSILSLRHNYKEVVEFLDEFHSLILSDRRKVHVDFNKVRAISSGASLVLVAELDRWRKLYNFRPAAPYLEKWDEGVRRSFEQMGLFEILEVVNTPTYNLEASDERTFIKYSTGQRVLGESAKKLKEVVSDLAEIEFMNKSMYDAIVEAMQNAIHHAYNEETKRSSIKLDSHWWMSGVFFGRDRRLHISFYDLGVGIPSALPARFGVEAIQEFLAGLGWASTDANKIYAAMELGRSGTGQKHRGKGLPQMRDFVDKFSPGSLRIISGHGELCYDSDENGVGAYRRTTHARPLEGTLIQWDIQLPSPQSQGSLI